MPHQSGMSFVIIMHLDPNHQGNISDVIANFTPMPVVEAVDGIPLSANTVYIIPPNKDLGIHNRKLLLLNPSKPKGFHLPIDYFLQSLAEDQWNKAVAVIFSGMGADGETGVRMIKEKLGIVMVQDPETADYSSMPLNAIGTNLVDYVLPPEEMPVKLIQFLNHPAILDNDEQITWETRNSNAIPKILMLLRSHTGHDFTLYKKNTITRRIDRRVAFHQLSDYAQYVNYLRENPHEIDVLFNELLIGVTKFFRDPAAFDSLNEKLNLILRKKPEDEPIRVWVAGCSTGEEAYTIAILLTEFAGARKTNKVPKIQIFATDLDADAIEQARIGSYHENIVADVSPERIERFFVRKNNCLIVKKELREMIVFAQHNIIKDAPFTRLDLLSCRNVMIYLTTELQKKIIPIYHYSLNPGGLLLMGPAETIGGFSDMFAPVDPKWKLFERKEGSSVAGRMIDFPFHISRPTATTIKTDSSGKLPGKKNMLDAFNKILLENFIPASTLINEKGDILLISGKPGKFIEIKAGEAVMNIHHMAKDELKYALSNAIHQARTKKELISVSDLKIKEENKISLVNLKVHYLEEPPLQGLVLIVFEDKGILRRPSARTGKNKENGKDSQLEELEKELIYTKQQLHNTIEQMETSVEELKSTNEELQSTNEELQSTNEESLTTKEEMQSLNEELMTINMQYQIKEEELTQLNNDMKNLLDNTEIDTIFIDNNLNILRFTPKVKKLFNLIHSDIGRSITDIASNFDYPNIESDVKAVIERLIVKEIEVKTKDNEWFSLRIKPYRTLDNFISGAVLSFHNITSHKTLEQKLRSLQKYSDLMLESLNKAALLLDTGFNIVSVNRLFLQTFHLKEEKVVGLSFPALARQHWKTTKLSDFMDTLTVNEAITTVQYNGPSSGVKKYSVTAKPLIDKDTHETFLFLIVIQE